MCPTGHQPPSHAWLSIISKFILQWGGQNLHPSSCYQGFSWILPHPPGEPTRGCWHAVIFLLCTTASALGSVNPIQETLWHFTSYLLTHPSIPLTWFMWKHIWGHQDDHAGPSTFFETWNVVMDFLLYYCSPGSCTLCFASKPWYIWLHRAKPSANLKSDLLNNISRAHTQTYWQNKSHFNGQDINLIDWNDNDNHTMPLDSDICHQVLQDWNSHGMHQTIHNICLSMLWHQKQNEDWPYPQEQSKNLWAMGQPTSLLSARHKKGDNKPTQISLRTFSQASAPGHTNQTHTLVPDQCYMAPAGKPFLEKLMYGFLVKGW